MKTIFQTMQLFLLFPVKKARLFLEQDECISLTIPPVAKKDDTVKHF